MLVHRVPSGLPWVFGVQRDVQARYSACLSCKTILTVRDLVPVFSWLLSRGRCRHCCAPVSKVYPMLEVLSSFVAVIVYFQCGTGIKAALMLALLPFLLALLFIDLKHMILPNILTAIAAVLGALYLCARIFVVHDLSIETAFLNHVFGGIVYAVLAYVLGQGTALFLKKEALGLGDVKFFAVAGLLLGLSVLPSFLIVSGLFGGGIGILWRWRTGRAHFPFGPALILSLYLLLMFGDVLGRSLFA